MNRAWGIVLAAASLAACTAVPRADREPPAAAVVRSPAWQAPPVFALAPGDELEIKLADQSYLNETAKIRPDGRITLPKIGDLMAAGLTPEALGLRISEAYMALGAADAPPASASYRLAVGDEIQVMLPYHSGLDQTVKVRPDGKITLALIGTLVAEGLTPESLGERVNELYGKQLRKPMATVSVRQFSSNRILVNGRPAIGGLRDVRATVLVRAIAPRQIYVGGEVRQPGVILHRPYLTALQALTEVGGLNPGANPAQAVVIRRTETGASLYPIDVRALASTGVDIPPADLVLEPSDLLIVPKTPIAYAADALEQILRLLPPLKNSTLGFVYEVNRLNVNGRVY